MELFEKSVGSPPTPARLSGALGFPDTQLLRYAQIAMDAASLAALARGLARIRATTKLTLFSIFLPRSPPPAQLGHGGQLHDIFGREATPSERGVDDAGDCHQGAYCV